MRIGIISDVHSNIGALRAVFDDFTNRGVEKVIYLGDIIGLGAHPEECVQFFREHQNLILAAVRGNHEDYLLKELPVHNHNDVSYGKLPQEILDLFRWNHEQISQESIEYLKTLPRAAIVEVEGRKLYACHYPFDQLGEYRKFFFRPNSAQCKQLFKDIDADIFLFGHTHIRCMIKSNNGQLFINPGSVGCPIGIEAASVGILNLEKDKLSYEQIDIPYDVDQAIHDLLKYSDRYPALDYTVNRFYRTLGD